MPRSSVSRVAPALLALALFAGDVLAADAAVYYGRHRGWGGATVVRRTTVVRRPTYGRGVAVVGRRGLLQDDDEYDASYEAPDVEDDVLDAAALAPAPAPASAAVAADGCLTVLDVVETRPELSALRDALASLPNIRAAMDDASRTDTFFAPTNDAIDGLTRWGGFVERAKGIDEMLGDVSLKALIIAYHAVPGVAYDAATLAELGASGVDNYLDTGLARILAAGDVVDDDAGGGSSAAEPLVVDEHEGNVFIKGIGSEAKVLTADVATCGGGFVHLIDAVLLPIDGDGVLDEFQQRRVKAIRDRARAIAETRRAARTEDEDDVDEDEDDAGTAAAPAAAPAAAGRRGRGGGRSLLQAARVDVEGVLESVGAMVNEIQRVVETADEDDVRKIVDAVGEMVEDVRETVDDADAADAPAPAARRRALKQLDDADADLEMLMPEVPDEWGEMEMAPAPAPAPEMMTRRRRALKQVDVDVESPMEEVDEWGEMDGMAPAPAPTPTRRRALKQYDLDDYEMPDLDGDLAGMAPTPAPAPAPARRRRRRLLQRATLTDVGGAIQTAGEDLVARVGDLIAEATDEDVMDGMAPAPAPMMA